MTTKKKLQHSFQDMLALGYGRTISTIYFKQAKKMVVPR